MEPMNVVTRREGFNLLSDVLWAWYAQETPVRNLLHYLESKQADPMIARRLMDGFSVPLVAFDGPGMDHSHVSGALHAGALYAARKRP